MSELFKKFSFDTGDFVSGDSDNDFTPGYMEVGDESKNRGAKEFAKNYGNRFKSNMADYFDKNPNPFDFTGKSEAGDISIGKKSDAFLAQIFPNFVKDYGPQKEAIGIEGTPGQPSPFAQIAGPIAGAAAQAYFACDMRLKHDIDCLTDMNLVKDDLADVAYFVKELQDS